MRSHAASRGRGAAEIMSLKLEEEGKPSHRWGTVDLLGVIFVKLSYFKRKYKKIQSAFSKNQTVTRKEKRENGQALFTFCTSSMLIEPIKSSPDVFLPK